MGKYNRCPRCELNWITEDKELCEVCKAELEGELIIDDEEEILCPRCKQNYLEPGEKLCSSCIANASAVDAEEINCTVEVDPIIDGETTVSLAEMEETEWNEDEENYDDDDGFGNEGDFVDTEIDSEFEEEEPVVVASEDEDDLDYVSLEELDAYDEEDDEIEEDEEEI